MRREYHVRFPQTPQDEFWFSQFVVFNEESLHEIGAAFERFITATRPLLADRTLISTAALDQKVLKRAILKLSTCLNELAGEGASEKFSTFLDDLRAADHSRAPHVAWPLFLRQGIRWYKLGPEESRVRQLCSQLAHLRSVGLEHGMPSSLPARVKNATWFRPSICLTVPVRCNHCLMEGSADVMDLRTLDFIFSCGCGHHYGSKDAFHANRKRNQIEASVQYLLCMGDTKQTVRLDCICRKCTRGKHRLVEDLEAIIREAGIIHRYQEWTERIKKDFIHRVDNEAMKRDYMLTGKKYSRELHIITAQNPKDITELTTIIKWVAEDSGSTFDRLWDEAEAARVIDKYYSYRAPTASTFAEILLASDLSCRFVGHHTGGWIAMERPESVSMARAVLAFLESGYAQFVEDIQNQILCLNGEIYLQVTIDPTNPIYILLHSWRVPSLGLHCSVVPAEIYTEWVVNPYFFGQTTHIPVLAPPGPLPPGL